MYTSEMLYLAAGQCDIYRRSAIFEKNMIESDIRLFSSFKDILSF